MSVSFVSQGKKLREKGKSFPTEYALYIENGMLRIYLQEGLLDPDCRVSFILYEGKNRINQIRETGQRAVSFRLERFGSYKLRLLFSMRKSSRATNLSERSVVYGFTTESVVFDEATALTTLRPSIMDATAPSLHNGLKKVIESDDVQGEYTLELKGRRLHLSLQSLPIDKHTNVSFLLTHDNDAGDLVTGDGLSSASFLLHEYGEYFVQVVLVSKGKKKESIVHFETEPIAYTEVLAMNTAISEYADAVSRIGHLIEMKKEREAICEIIKGRIQEAYSLRGSVSAYFEEKGMTSVCLYCEEADADLGVMICKDFQVNSRVRVPFFFSSQPYTMEYPDWLYTAGPTFEPITEESLQSGMDSIILVVSANKELEGKSELNRIADVKKATVLYLIDMVKDISYHYQYKPVREFAEAHPHTKIYTFTNPKFPTKGTRNENEHWMFDNEWSRNASLRSLRSDSPILSKAFQDYGYSIEDAREVMEAYPQYETEEGTARLHDRRGKLVNIVEGHRVTTDVPDDFDRTIYILGGCSAFGVAAQDSETLASWLQRILNEKAPEAKFAVMNYGIFAARRRLLIVNDLRNLQCSPGDVVFIQIPGVSGIPNCNFSSLYERPHNFGEVYADCSPDVRGGHRSMQGQKALAEQFFYVLAEDGLLKEPDRTAWTQDVLEEVPAPKVKRIDVALTKELDAYKRQLLEKKRPGGGRTGAIVMNCNPFTLGHRYLIEYASGQVDQLYIFVVQEDKSFFSFEDRLALVSEGVRDLENVTVIPSGKFIISSITFSDYFAKQALKDRVIDSSNDVSLFAEEIAPMLDISVRFVGEEPLCNVTRQYNNTMKKILPRYNIELIIIPRKESEGEPISASRVRALLEDRDFDSISRIVPKTTYDYLKKRFGEEV